MKKIIFIFLFLILFVFFIGCSKEQEETVTITINNIEIEAEIADEPVELNTGLMLRDHLPAFNGMWFIFPQQDTLKFWMKNTLIPLDIIYVDNGYKIVDIKHNVPPCDTSPCPTYPSILPAQYVLEVNAGFTEQYNIREGDTIIVSS